MSTPDKKYIGYPIKGYVYCIDKSNALLLHHKSYAYIHEDDTRFLIKFSTGAAHWYDKTRFVKLEHVVNANQAFEAGKKVWYKYKDRLK